jgi:hypothetical protein
MHLRFVTRNDLVGCLAQILVEVETVDCMASGVNCFGPKNIRCLVFIKHGASGFYQSSILSLHNTISLRSIWSGELMLDSLLIKKFFNVGISEF